jgi:hypothetical protein
VSLQPPCLDSPNPKTEPVYYIHPRYRGLEYGGAGMLYEEGGSWCCLPGRREGM